MEIQNYAQPQNRVDQVPPVSDVVNQSSVLRASANRRKRGRKETAPAVTAAAAAAADNNLMLLRGLPSSVPSSMFVNPVPPPQRPPPSSQFFQEVNAPYVKDYLADVDAYLRAQDEQQRRTVLEKWQRHNRNLLLAVEMSAARRIREKEALAEQAMRQCVELKQQLALSRAASASWQARIVAAEHSAASLRAQLEQALAITAEGTGESGGGSGRDDDDDAESAHIDPSGLSPRACRVCRRADEAVVAVVPCGHLCLCADCSAAGGALTCPCCGQPGAGTFRVVFC